MRVPLSILEEGPGVPLLNFEVGPQSWNPRSRCPGRRVLVPLLHHVKICENFEHFQYFNFEKDFLENKNLFQNTVASFFS